MEDLIQKLMDEGGLTKEQAEKALGIVKDHIMGMLPPMMQPMVETFMGGAKKDDSDF